VAQECTPDDCCVVIARISKKGLELCVMLKSMNTRHRETMSRTNFKIEDLNI
jgi:hypothetical protein